ncbi:DUF1868 domain-containing protein [Rhizobium sp. S152]|uniref:DUF1868 domain-containing protein n=1 Tax=Rhizobium sp. S152 TaxID=3055038 RepID=UPI0025A96D0F|nr:DUF1868 domain-containing protein [Rhizobium sp. S152]MDM9624391.1 DUF1868 domain-containing protein [Rhizobium sp. S152]
MTTTVFSSSLLDYSAARNSAPPRHLGTRYGSDGHFLREPGNTVVSHLVEGTSSQRAVIEARQAQLDMPEASQFAFTPISSLHMTLFQGIIEYRRALPYWPGDIALDTPIDSMTDVFHDRLRTFAAPEPFNVEAIAVTPAGLTVAGATQEDRRIMKDWRDALAGFFGYRHPDHDSYVFHITFAYPVRWLDDAALPAWQDMLDRTLEDLRRKAPVIALRPPAFCAFEDMNHFTERLVLTADW